MTYPAHWLWLADMEGGVGGGEEPKGVQQPIHSHPEVAAFGNIRRPATQQLSLICSL